MSKATIADLQDEGFRPEQFGLAAGDASWSAPGGYLGKLVDEAGRWAAQRIGDTLYAGVVAATYVHDCLVRAEVQYVRAILFKRRVAFFDSAANIGRELPAYAERRGYADDAKRSMDCANEWIAEAQRALGIDPSITLAGTGSSMTLVETGRYPALNA